MTGFFSIKYSAAYLMWFKKTVVTPLRGILAAHGLVITVY